MRAQTGFTLMEVMIALAVIAIGLSAVIGVTGGAAGNAAYLRDKSLGHWVATDRLTELQVTRAWPGVGHDSGSVEMAGQTWRWEMDVAATPDEFVRKVDIRVRLDGSDQNVAAVNGYLPRYAPQ